LAVFVDTVATTGVISRMLWRPGHELHLSPPSGAEVQNAWNVSSTSLYAFMEWCLGTGVTVNVMR